MLLSSRAVYACRYSFFLYAFLYCIHLFIDIDIDFNYACTAIASSLSINPAHTYSIECHMVVHIIPRQVSNP